jgi:chromate transporter
MLNLNFLVTLLAAGSTYALAGRKQKVLAFLLAAGFVVWLIVVGFSQPEAAQALPDSTAASTNSASLPTLFWSGLKSGLLTFGGAYTVIPFLQRDAVQAGGWMTNAQFLDGLALSGLLPAPLIIFSTFVGYIGGLPGATSYSRYFFTRIRLHHARARLPRTACR